VLSAYWRLYEWMAHFIPQFNHELRTPLTAVQGSLGMVLGGVFGEVGSEVKEMLEMAHKGCERTVLAIEEYLNKQGPTEKS
jgi:signal transduction histidine kinase